MKKIAVIGAGLSGLTFASQMNSIADVTVFEKSRGIGGRMATRYAQTYEFDHGAQYFTAKSEAFKNFLKPHIISGVVKDWQPKLVTITNSGVEERVSNHPSYAASPRMNSLAKEMAKDLNFIGTTHIEKLEGESGAWVLVDKENQTYGSFDIVVLAIPSHQAEALLPSNFPYLHKISEVKMDACFSLMLGFEKNLELGFEGAFVENSSIGWMSVNSSKPQRPDGFSLMLQSHNTWAEDHVEDDKSQVQAMLINEASKLLNMDLSTANYKVLHRWLYASTSKPAGEAFFFDETQNLASIGDWCIRGRVEAAFESGLALAEKMKALL